MTGPCGVGHAGAITAVTKDVTELFRQAKGIVEMMPRYTHMEGFTFRQVSKPSWADNVVWMNIYCGDEQVGNLALLSKRASMDCGIKNLSVMLFELDQELLKPLRSRTNTFTHMPEYPVADYDVSVLLDREVKWEAVREAILGKHTGGLLKDAAFVDEYRGKQVPVKVGLAPVQRDDVEYEFDIMFTIGRDHIATTSKDVTFLDGFGAVRLAFRQQVVEADREKHRGGAGFEAEFVEEPQGVAVK